MRKMLRRAAPILLTVWITAALLLGGAYMAVASMFVYDAQDRMVAIRIPQIVAQVFLTPGGNPTTAVFPGPFFLVFGVTGSVASGAATQTGGSGYPSGVCGVAAATTTGHNTYWISATPFGAAVATPNNPTAIVTTFTGSGASITVANNPAQVMWGVLCN